MTNARREVLQNQQFRDDVHPGLWIDKMLHAQRDKTQPSGDHKTARSQHIQRLLRIKVPQGYGEAYRRWEHDHARSGHLMAYAEVQGRMVIGIGNKGPLEIGLTLHHTWGTPFIPGSALKGIAAATAARLLEDDAWRGPSKDQEPGEAYRKLFGLQSQRGKVIFHDALWIPKGHGLPLKPDVMTVHHARYYQTDAQQAPPPSDTDSPNPVSFVSITGEYLIALAGPREYCQSAMEILAIGLEDLGIGAKTNAGYGRLTLEQVDLRPLTPEIWIEKNHAELTSLSAADMFSHVLSFIQSPPPIPDALPHDECLSRLRNLLAPAATHAQALLKESNPQGVIEELQKKLDETLKQKPKKKKGKPFKDWQKLTKRLENQIQGAQGSQKHNEQQVQEANQVMAWLTGQTSPTTPSL